MKTIINKCSVLLCLVMASVGVTSAAPNYTLFGDASLVSPGQNSPTAARLRSQGPLTAPTYGGVDIDVPAGLTVADLDTLSADYMFSAGSCAGGSPRFQVYVSNGTTTGNVFVYLSSSPMTNDCGPTTFTDTGNLIAGTRQVDATQIGGGYPTYASFQSGFGGYDVTGIQFVADGSWALAGLLQTVIVDNLRVNGTVVTFESANTCKNNGWQSFTTAPGPFDNQGQCVSHFAKGGQ